MSRPTAVSPPRPGRLVVVRTPRGVWVGWRGGAKFFAPVAAEAAAAATAHEDVRAPMTGRIVKVAVAAGEKVAKDDLVVILEAMKMEYRLTAPRAGTIGEIRCRNGDLVDLGATLVVLEARAEGSHGEGADDSGGGALP